MFEWQVLIHLMKFWVLNTAKEDLYTLFKLIFSKYVTLLAYWSPYFPIKHISKKYNLTLIVYNEF